MNNISENMKIVMVGSYEDEYPYGVYSSDIAEIVAERLRRMTDEPVSVLEAGSPIPPEPPEGCRLFHIADQCVLMSIYGIIEDIAKEPEYFWATDLDAAREQWVERLGAEYLGMEKIQEEILGTWLAENTRGYGIEYYGKHYCYVVQTTDRVVYILSKGEIAETYGNTGVFDLLEQLKEDPSILNWHGIPDGLPTSLTPEELEHNLRVMDERRIDTEEDLCN